MEGGAQGSNVFDYPNQDTERGKRGETRGSCLNLMCLS